MKKVFFLVLVLFSKVALCEQIYENSNITIFSSYPAVSFEISENDLLKSAFVKKPYEFHSSDNSFKIDCTFSSCKVKVSLTSKENLNTKIPFVEQTISKLTCNELIKKFKPAIYLFDNHNLELQFFANDNCAIRYFNLYEIDPIFKEFLLYKESERNKIDNFPGNIKDVSWVKNKLRALVKIDKKAGSVWSYSELNKLKPTDKIYFEKVFKKTFFKDTKNISELKELLNEYNWFVISKFGKETDSDAWSLVWHKNDINFQKTVLKRLEKLYLLGETSKKHYAYLYDHIAVSENKPQKYGTIGYCVGKGMWEPAPLEDAKLVDKFRLGVELESMSEYKKRFKETCLQADGSSTVSLRIDE